MPLQKVRKCGDDPETQHIEGGLFPVKAEISYFFQLARFELQRYAHEQKIRFSLSNPKNGAFQLALSRNAILTSESKRTPHF